MFLNAEDLILKDKAQLYNNLAEVNGVQGRLLAELEIWPRGRLTYDFQVLGEHSKNPALSLSHAFEQTPYPPIYGHFFTIDEPGSGGVRWGEGPSSAIYGNTAKAAFGNSTDDAHTFDFYLPNTRFQRVRANQELIITETKVRGTNRQIAENSSGYYLEVPVDGIWSIILTIREDAQSWLDTKNRNIGTRITTRGRLFQHNFSFRNPSSFDSLKLKTLDEAFEELRMLSALLSFANGGYLGPFYVQGSIYNNEKNYSPIYNINAFALNYKTTPLEQLHDTWLTYDSDLALYIQRLPTLKRMLNRVAWKEAFDHLRSHYFQTLGENSWSIRFSALGSALERLAYTILVEDRENKEIKQKYALLFNPKQRSQAKKEWNLKNGNLSTKRIQLLLEEIGLIKARGHDDTEDVQAFVHLRNDAVHIELAELSAEEITRSFRKALQWLEEGLLWRLGYAGKYADRTSYFPASTKPRYDCDLRAPNWDSME